MAMEMVQQHLIYQTCVNEFLFGLDTDDVETEENDITFDSLGKKLGEKKHQLTVNELPAHRFMLNIKQAGSGINQKNQWGVNTVQQENMGDTYTEWVGSSVPHSNVQQSLVCNFIIKAK